MARGCIGNYIGRTKHERDKRREALHPKYIIPPYPIRTRPHLRPMSSPNPKAPPRRRHLRSAALIALLSLAGSGALSLGGCSSGGGFSRGLWPGLYVPVTEQGNIYSAKQIASLRIGMRRAEVLHIMGSPQLQDPFHVDRWDYYYSKKRGPEVLERRILSLHFENDALRHIDRRAE